MSTLRITDRDELVFEGARVIWLELDGKITDFNDKGEKRFQIVIEDPEMAQDLIDRGWNVRTRVPKNSTDPENETFYTLQVTVRFGGSTRVYMIQDGAKTPLSDETIGVLQSVRIGSADIVVRPYDWEMRGRTGRKAYLKTMYATIEVEDEFADKYVSEPEEMPFQ